MMNTTNYSLADESRQNLLAIYSDVHKDATGTRPYNWSEVCKKTDSELVEGIEYYSKLAEQEMELERQQRVEQRARWAAHIEGIMRDNGVNRGTALRWDMAAMDATGAGDDVGYYCFLWNLGYDLEHEIAAELKDCG
jgi:hypothetical protein